MLEGSPELTRPRSSAVVIIILKDNLHVGGATVAPSGT